MTGPAASECALAAGAMLAVEALRAVSVLLITHERLKPPHATGRPVCPWEICRTDLDSETVRAVLTRLKQTGRVVLGDTSDTQPELFL